jgi:hypothetical protein
MFGKRRVRGLEPRCVQDRQIRMIAKVAAFTLAASPAFAQTFFPPGALPDSAATRYTRFLKAMHEPSLFELASHDRPLRPMGFFGCAITIGQPAFVLRSSLAVGGGSTGA